MRPSLIVSAGVVAAACLSPLFGTASVASAAPAQVYGATWTADSAGNSLTEYAPTASGLATPIASITGADTDLDGPSAVAVGASGNLVVANAANDSITEYAAGATDDAAPTRVISGPVTGLAAPSSVSIAGGQIWVTDPSTNVIEAFSAGSNGNVLPAESVSGPKTQLNHPIAVNVDDESGFITVLNAPTSGPSSIDTYFGGQYGDITPIARISGSTRALAAPVAMVSAGFGVAWIADSTGSVSEVLTLAISLHTFVTISGSKTGLEAPTGVSLDAVGDVVVTDGGAHTVSLFSHRASGDVAPMRTVQGVGSAAGSPSAVTVTGTRPDAPTDVVAVAHNASATVHWQAPTFTGGGIIGYNVEATTRKTIHTGSGTVTIESGVGTETSKTSITLRHLKNGQKYFFVIQAINTFGQSAGGRSATVTPVTVPGAPTSIIALGGTDSIAVAWSKPAKDGGKPISRYRLEYATCSPAAVGCAFHSQLVPGSEHRARITGLTAGTKYHVRVIAHTSVGNSRPSKVTTATAT